MDQSSASIKTSPGFWVNSVSWYVLVYSISRFTLSEFTVYKPHLLDTVSYICPSSLEFPPVTKDFSEVPLLLKIDPKSPTLNRLMSSPTVGRVRPSFRPCFLRF